MEIYSPKKGQVTKFSRNVLKADVEKEKQKRLLQEETLNLKFEKKTTGKAKVEKNIVRNEKKDGLLKKALNSFYGYVSVFFDSEEVV
ncbi:MAG TPA: hypothetical protein PLI16_06110 [Bacteroidales bacterium]|nr:hypothetical protein [Bacteroidales bacterium]HNZ43910.1 hypothetical protein [Bacteroidales bacterium]HOH84171.1 hypothetical protein [Bacteroidales bacterium]HPB26459.1 hypothetical protein [Bacteroidales bacterium]HPI31228.1 hypothetical protein [Bacteroidales bacterium]